MAEQAMATLDAGTLKAITDFAIEKYREVEFNAAQARYDKRKANTKLLLKHYRSLVEHCESATFTASQVDTDDGYSLAEILELINGNTSDRLKVESIRQSAIKTKIIIDHINTMINLYKSFCEQSPKDEDMRRYRVIYWLYLDEEPKTADELADEEYTEKRMIYRDVNIAVEQLTAFIFGIDGINLLVK